MMSFATTFAFWGISTWIPPYIGAFAAKAGRSAQEWASYGGMALNGAAVFGYVGFGFLVDAYGRKPMTIFYVLASLASVALLFLWAHDLTFMLIVAGAVRHLRLRPVHLDGGMAAGAVPDPHAGDRRGLRVQHAAPHRLDRAADLRLADLRGRRLQPGRRRDLARSTF